MVKRVHLLRETERKSCSSASIARNARIIPSETAKTKILSRERLVRALRKKKNQAHNLESFLTRSLKNGNGEEGDVKRVNGPFRLRH